MPGPAVKKRKNQTKTKSASKQKTFGIDTLRSYLKILWTDLIMNTDYYPQVGLLMLVFEFILNAFIISTVPYTEIDWKAYMQEVEGFANGTYDYSQLKGDTGPLVYPAGFVYVFYALYHLTDSGKNLKLAQYVFMLLYLVTLYLLYRIYYSCKKVPPYVFILCCCTSYRIHSIYVLRLFNDPVAVMLFYLSLNLFLAGKWSLGSIVYSLAVSVKMNILLYAPALLAAYLLLLGVAKTVKMLFICASVQLFVGLPFLMVNPQAYIHRSFDLGRVFLYEWTVNWRFIPEDVFVSRYFHVLLLIAHIALLCCFYRPIVMCFQSYGKLRQLARCLKPQLDAEHESVDMNVIGQLFVMPFFVVNFVGMVCSRSLHYQFYVWYYHTLPFLLWSTNFSVRIRLMILGLIEMCWNTYPSTYHSSLCLFVCHFAILGNMLRRYIKMQTALNDVCTDLE